MVQFGGNNTSFAGTEFADRLIRPKESMASAGLEVFLSADYGGGHVQSSTKHPMPRPNRSAPSRANSA